MARILRLAKNLTLPVEAVTETFAFLAKRGAGKSYSASVLAEEMLRHHFHVVVLDPMGIWFGLRTAADGKGDGYQIPILGGDHGDIPLESTGGAHVADLVVNDRISMVIDVSDFSKKKRKQFVADFAERLYKKNRQPLHLVLEEADMFAPQKPREGEHRMLGAIEDIVRRGRSRGIGVSLISQRSAVLNKDVLTQTECLVAMRTTGPHDRKAIGDWIDAQGDRDAKKEVMDSLPGLPTGTAWFWSPGWLGILEKVAINQKRTLDTGATPKVGGKRKALKTTADVDLTVLTGRMKHTILKAQEDDPKYLWNKIRQLKQQVAKLETRPEGTVGFSQIEVGKKIDVAVATTNQSWQNVVTEKNKEIAGLLQKMERLAVKLGAMSADVLGDYEAAKEFARQAKTFVPDPPPKPPPGRTIPEDQALPKSSPATDSALARAPDGAIINNSEQRILDAIAWLNAVGVDEPNQSAVSFLAGFKSAESGGYKNPRSRLRVRELVDYRGRQIALTDEGRAIAHAPKVAPNAAGLHSAVFAKIKGPEKKLLRLLLDAHPEPMGNEALAAAAGYDPTSGGFKNPRSRLRTLGLVEYPTGGETRANDFLFPGY